MEAYKGTASLQIYPALVYVRSNPSGLIGVRRKPQLTRTNPVTIEFRLEFCVA